MSTILEMAENRIREVEGVKRKLEERLVKLNDQLRERREKTSEDDEIYVDLLARRFEVNEAIVMLKQALK